MSARFHLYLSGIFARSRSWATTVSVSATRAMTTRLGFLIRHILKPAGPTEAGHDDRCLRRFVNSLAAVHVGPKRRRNRHRPVLFLIILENRDERPPDRETRPVERVHEFGLSGAAGAELDIRAPGLKRLGIAAGRDLAVRLLARQPHFDVIGL